MENPSASEYVMDGARISKMDLDIAWSNNRPGWAVLIDAIALHVGGATLEKNIY